MSQKNSKSYQEGLAAGQAIKNADFNPFSRFDRMEREVMGLSSEDPYLERFFQAQNSRMARSRERIQQNGQELMNRAKQQEAEKQAAKQQAAAKTDIFGIETVSSQRAKRKAEARKVNET